MEVLLQLKWLSTLTISWSELSFINLFGKLLLVIINFNGICKVQLVGSKACKILLKLLEPYRNIELLEEIILH